MAARTRLDRLVFVRERVADLALTRLARARESTGEARDRLVALRAACRSDGRAPESAALWTAAEQAHHRTLVEVRGAERSLASAHQAERQALAAFGSAERDAELSRRAQARKVRVIEHEQERRSRAEADEIATRQYNAHR